MVAFIKVVDTPFATKADAKGQAMMRDVPAGTVQVHIWHPYLKSADNEIVRTVVVPVSGSVRETVQLDVRSSPDRRGAY